LNKDDRKKTQFVYGSTFLGSIAARYSTTWLKVAFMKNLRCSMIKKLTLVMFLLIATSIGPTCFEVFGAVTPSALKCEYLVDPKGIDSLAPRLSWILISGERGQKQTAYQILVASSKKKLADGIGDLWDSKKVNSDQSIHVVYQGRSLKSRMTCFWKVRILFHQEIQR